MLIGAGAAVALQVGKVPAALPMLQDELGLTLVQSGWVVAIFSVVAAMGAVFLGSISDRFGPLQVAISGMVTSALAGFLGSFSPDGTFLLVTRVIEGLGFILTTTSIPSLIIAASTDRHRKAALALWGTYMPFGSGIMLALSGPILHVTDWNTLWVITSALILAMAVPVFLTGRSVSGSPEKSAQSSAFPQGLVAALGCGPILLAAIFAIYAGLYMIVVGFLPLILIEKSGYSALHAASIGAIVVFCNAAGNILSGWLHGKGVGFHRLILVGSIGTLIGGSVVFLDGVAAQWRIAGAMAFCGFGGLVPSSLFSESRNHTPDPRLLGTVSGVLFQGAAIGQLAGPPLAAGLAAWSGAWSLVVPLFIFGSLTMLACTKRLRPSI